MNNIRNNVQQFFHIVEQCKYIEMEEIMAKTHVGFRFNDEILSKITVLQEIENEEAKKADRQPKDKTAIVTQAIEFYYVQKLSAGEADI